MKKISIVFIILLVISLLIITTCTSIQTTDQSSDRINDSLPFVKEIKQMTSIVGWSKWSNGKWYSKNNLIPDEDDVKYDIVGSQGIDNIQSLKMYNVEFNGQKYILFQKKNISAKFKYPALKMDFYKYTCYEYYLIKNDILKIFISKDETIKNKIAIYKVFYTEDNYNIKKITEEVYRAIISEYSDPDSHDKDNNILEIPTYYNEKDKVVRFLFNKSIYKYEHYFKDMSLEDDSLSKFYFETKYDVFHNFFTPYIQNRED